MTTVLVYGIPFFLVFAAICWFIWPFQPAGTPITVASASSQSGQEFRVVQVWTGTTDFYESQLWFREDEDTWGFFVLSPDDLRWRNCRIVIDEEHTSATVARGRRTIATFDWTDRALTFPATGLRVENVYGRHTDETHR